MSQQFYERFVSLFFGFIILLMLAFVTVELILFYFSMQNIIFYYAYLGMLLSDFFYFIKYYLWFRDFRETLSQGLLFPSKNEEISNLESLEIKGLEDTPLKACLSYRNGATFDEITEFLGLSHPTQAKRELIKGLDILLKFHEKHRKKVRVLS